MKYLYQITYVAPIFHGGQILHCLEAISMQSDHAQPITIYSYTRDLITIINELGLFGQKNEFMKTMKEISEGRLLPAQQWGFALSTNCASPNQAIQLYSCQLRALKNGREYKPMGLHLYMEFAAQMLANMEEPHKPGAVELTGDDIRELTIKMIKKLFPKGKPNFDALEEFEQRIQKYTDERVKLRPADRTEIPKERNWGEHEHLILRVGYWRMLVTIRAWGQKPFQIRECPG